MKGWTITAGAIFERELRWVDAHDDTVTDGDGKIHGPGEWALMLDTAKDIALKQAVLKFKKASSGVDGYAISYWKERVRMMRADGNYNIFRKGT